MRIALKGCPFPKLFSSPSENEVQEKCEFGHEKKYCMFLGDSKGRHREESKLILKQRKKSILGSKAHWFKMRSRGGAKHYLIHLKFSYSNIYSCNLEALLPGFNPSSIACYLCNFG